MLKKMIFICLGVGLLIMGICSMLYLSKTENKNASFVQTIPISKIPLLGFPEKESAEWTLFITGDVIPVRVTNQKAVEKNDFFWPFAHIAPLMKDADLTLINLETPLLTQCPITNEGLKFCGDARFAQALSESGVDIANVANNHTLNYGWEGLRETEQQLKAVGTETTGFMYGSGVTSSASSSSSQNDTSVCAQNVNCSKFITKNIKGVSVGFLGYNAVGQLVDRELVSRQIKDANTQVDVLIVSVHWGKEYVREPATDSIAVDDPRELGRLFVDSGADVVVGNHPHWYQPIKWIGEKVVFYALGNTLFDQEWSLETKVGFLTRLHFQGSDLKKEQIEIVPIGIRDYGQTYILEGEDKQKVLDFLKQTF